MDTNTSQYRPYWLPDTQGFLAVAIIALIACIVMVLLTTPPSIDERTAGVLMTVVGVLVACLKDVYSFFFGSSRGSEKKDDAIIKGALDPNGNGGARAAAEAAAPAAAAAAAPPAAQEAAPPAAEIAVDAALSERGLK